MSSWRLRIILDLAVAYLGSSPNGDIAFLYRKNCCVYSKFTCIRRSSVEHASFVERLVIVHPMIYDHSDIFPHHYSILATLVLLL